MILTRENLHMYCQECGGCMLWKLGTTSNDIPCARIDGKVTNLRRYVYGTLFGKTLRAGTWVTVRCGNARCLGEDCLIQKAPGDVLSGAHAKKVRENIGHYLALRAAIVRCGRAKLDMQKAQQIREAARHESQASIARRFGLHHSTVADVIHGRSWRAPTATSVFNWCQPANDERAAA